MTTVDETLPRERILRAALALLEADGVGAVSTRAVSSAAGVQAPTIYRQFGDMQGLLDAVAYQGFSLYLRHKVEQQTSGDPVQDLHVGWDRHVQFGLDHPHLYTLMYSASASSGRERGPVNAAALEAEAMLRDLLVHVAGAGRLAIGVDRAAALIHAAGTGLTLSLIGAPQQAGLAALMRATVFGAILTPGPEGTEPGDTARQRAAGHAAALDALLPGLDAPLSAPERALFSEWLHRIG